MPLKPLQAEVTRSVKFADGSSDDVRHGRVVTWLLAVWRFALPLIAVAVIWQIIVWVSKASPILMPSIGQILAETWRLMETGVLFQHIAYTVARLFIGFLVGSAIGVVGGLVASRVRWFEAITVPLAAMLMPIPILAFVPLFILWFGLGNLSVVALVILGAMTPVFVNVHTGAKSVDQTLIAAAQTMGARGGILFRTVVFPASLPFIITGLRIGLARSWRAVISGELVSSSAFGLGWMIFNAQSLLQTSAVLVGIAFIGIVGALLEKILFARLENVTLGRWGLMTQSGN